MVIQTATVENTLPVKVQGELIPVTSLFLTAMIVLINKYGENGLLELDKFEAIKYTGGSRTVEIEYSFERDCLQLRVHK